MNKLYNNVILEDGFSSKPCDFSDTPYLKDRPDVIDVSAGRQLFVDNFLIENTDLTPEYHKAHKYEGNPVLFPEMPWERERSPAACPKSGGVWYDEEEKIFKMWYEGTWLGYMCYATSEDGIHWHRPILNDGKTNNILPYERGESDEETIGNGMYCNGATGLAKLRRDGFVSMNGEGKLTTRMLQFFGKEDMYVNIDGSVYAKIFDENGEVLASSVVFEGDSTCAKLTFDGFRISELNGKVFRIEFTVCGKLYSFGFADKSGDFGGAHAAGVVRV